MVHQHFMLIPALQRGENIMLGDETTHLGTLEPQMPYHDVYVNCHNTYGLDVDPSALVGQLSVGAQQRVEIIKTLYRNAQIVILDEPYRCAHAARSRRFIRHHAPIDWARRFHYFHHPQVERGISGR